MRYIAFAIAASFILITLMGCGHMAVSYSPTPLTLGEKAAPKAETTEAAASTKEEGS